MFLDRMPITKDVVNMYSINLDYLLKHKEVLPLIDPSFFSAATYGKGIKRLENIDAGGFDHGDMSGLYVRFQNEPRYAYTRAAGWRSIFQSMTEEGIYGTESQGQPLIIDFLAGAGTLSKRVRSLWQKKAPSVLGLDVSEKMCAQALAQNEIVFWGTHDFNPFRENIANVSIAAYGLHHVPTAERSGFVSNMKRAIKPGGTCILHDFIENSSTARFYSELIDNYRIYGHPYKHFTCDEMTTLLEGTFKSCKIKHIYDPFYLEGLPGQNEELLKREFFCYLILLFNLKKLIPRSVSYETLFNYNNDSYWRDVESIMHPYFQLSDAELGLLTDNERDRQSNEYLKEIPVDLVNKITINSLADGRLSLIAPRIAIMGIGRKAGNL